MSDPIPFDVRVNEIEAWLPQTQCAQCGYSGCRPYAEALAAGAAQINRCPPGGEATVRGLANLLGLTPRPLDPACGPAKPRAVALIDEAACIGCTLCIKACPVDAIVGAAKQMHTVLTRDCTGCQLCLPPCPVDCIRMVPVAVNGAGPWPDYGREETAHWHARAQRARTRTRRAERLRRSAATLAASPPTADRAAKKAEIRAAVARVKAKRQRQP